MEEKDVLIGNVNRQVSVGWTTTFHPMIRCCRDRHWTCQVYSQNLDIWRSWNHQGIADTDITRPASTVHPHRTDEHAFIRFQKRSATKRYGWCTTNNTNNNNNVRININMYQKIMFVDQCFTFKSQNRTGRRVAALTTGMVSRVQFRFRDTAPPTLPSHG